MLAHQLCNASIRKFASTKRVDGDGGGLGHTNRVGHLDFAALRQARRDDILRHITARIRR